MIQHPHVHTEQEILNSSFDEGLGILIVETIGADGVLKNPATEETQLLVKAAIENIVVPAPVGGATSVKQSDGSQKTQIVDAGGEAVTVTGGKLDVNASVDTTGLALEAGNLASIKTNTDKIPSLGQAIAAASVPVILPSATITTLTPPAAITGFATEAGHIATVDTSTAAVNTLLGAKTDAKSTATDATSVSAMQVLKQISASVQAPPAQAVTFTGSGDVATQTTLALIKAKTDNLDVLLSTRTKPSDAQHIIIDSGNPTAITANAGTNLNTSTLAIETGGNLASVKTNTDNLSPSTNAPITFQKAVTTAGTRVQLDTNTCKWMIIKSKATNTGLIYVGSVAVTSSNGYILTAGEAISFDGTNTNLFYIDSSVNGEGVSVIARS
jgi:hypothetical protein